MVSGASRTGRIVIVETPGAAADHARYTQSRLAHWETVAARQGSADGGRYYRRRLRQVFAAHVPSGQRVLEVGCATGELLAAVAPAHGVGIDFSPLMVTEARRRHPELTFHVADAHDLSALAGPFDVVILSDLMNDVWDVQQVLEQVARICHAGTRVVVNNYSRLWEAPLSMAAAFGMSRPRLQQNWLTVADVTNLFHLAGFEVVRHWPEVVWPLPTPVVASIANRYLSKVWPFRLLALTNVMVARPHRLAVSVGTGIVSVIVPARNESGNVEQIFARTPEMGSGTELVFIEGHSKDDTYEAIERAITRHPERRARLARQEGIGKGDAVRLGFHLATGEVLMILDADLTVPPEDLPRFVAALRDNDAEFVNGVRLVYPMEKHAMRFFNLIGNKFFSVAFSWMLGQPIKDTLCGTKVLTKANYERIAANRQHFGDFDPFGDFDLLFGAARLSLRIVDLPIRYRERTYGTTNIQRWRHGWLLLRMVAFAARRLKFV
jgi:ubiquinone/menaquinone biosynthesis C-methylase UbiE